MAKEIPSQYNASEHEDRIYKMWEQSGAFSPDIRYSKLDIGKSKRRSQISNIQYPISTFSIVMPPPNVTGMLHIGHAVMLALEDIMVRYHRMRGDRTLWLPGTDHAAIATQTVVEKKLKKEKNLRRQDLGREKFLEEVEKFVAASKDRIHLQIRKMGASCDWSREAYTMDEPRTYAVRTAFKMLYDKGLIYRGDRIVNWCPRCKSTLADDEVEYKEQKSPFYYFKYGPVVIGTARPETKFLDKTIVVHPDDKRYKKLHGKEMAVEWIDGKVKANVIADPVVDPEFGTGAMTITPAHSFEDFDLAQKYGLPIVKIIDEDGNFTVAAGAFAGRSARKSRDEIVEILQKKGLVERIDENYTHNLSICYRCETPVEPLPKLQWFITVNKPFIYGDPISVKTEIGSRGIKGLRRGQKITLKQLMRHAVESGQVEIVPERFVKNYYHWIDNLRDWCISRQIWFGHRIPVWYCRGIRNQESGIRNKNTTHDSLFIIHNSKPCPPIVTIEEPKSCPVCRSVQLAQDEDTLDTWFSSGLWTFSTLGWPDATEDFRTFHPTSVLETGYDILFFWIARMILMSGALIGEVPFRTVYLHGLVRDMQGRKMSKSLGNVIDPLDMTEKYGADAVRISLFMGTSAGTDVKLNEQKIAGYRNFANKIWNASRFVLMNVDHDTKINVGPGLVPGRGGAQGPALRPADKKILAELDEVVKKVTTYLDKFDFNHAGDLAYHYFWHTFCDKIIEQMKPRLGTTLNPSSTRRGNESISSPARGFPPLPEGGRGGVGGRGGSDDRHAAQYILFAVLTACLKLLHPFMPFVTEAVWQMMPQGKKSMLITEQWPK